MEDRYYFAYGSNMNLEQMKYRCPAAEVVENVRLEDYRLAAFQQRRRSSRQRSSNGTAEKEVFVILCRR